jgi:threonine dehydrogenase-like Zn-dependent dehydrogenase
MLGMSHFFQPVEQPISPVFMRNVSLHPGVAPTRAYIPELLPEVERGTIKPGVVFTHDLPLDDAPKGFEIMDSRAEGSIKVALTP